MRPVFAILISCSLLGGVFGYIRFADSVRRPPLEIQIDYAEGDYSLEIERTFDCVSWGTDSLGVLFKGKPAFSTQEPIAASEKVIVESLEGVEIGENEIYVTATMSDSTPGLGVMKVIVRRDDIVIAEQLIASQEGLFDIAGAVVFEHTSASDENDSQ